MTVPVPLLNANEDRVTLVTLAVTDGDVVRTGDRLATVETSKATADIVAPCRGVVRGVKVTDGAELKVGSTLCTIEESEPVEAMPDHPEIGRYRAVVIGGGRHAACVLDALGGSGFDVIGCLDDVKMIGFEVIPGAKVIDRIDHFDDLCHDSLGVFIGVGGATDNEPRAKLFDRLARAGATFPPLVHRTAHVAPGVILGPGTVVLANATIGPGCVFGGNTIINQGANVCHHCTIGDHVHLAPGSILAGGCRIGTGSTVGMAATVFIDVEIGRWCLVDNGVAVTNNLADRTHLTHK